MPDLPVKVRITHSGINYKDALSLTRRAPIARSFPMVAGVDLVGSVVEDRSGVFSPGEIVVATGNGLGEKRSFPSERGSPSSSVRSITSAAPFALRYSLSAGRPVAAMTW